MTLSEFSREFDVLYNNIASGAAPGVNAYEKSLFLTYALETIVKEYYTGNSDLEQLFNLQIDVDTDISWYEHCLEE